VSTSDAVVLESIATSLDELARRVSGYVDRWDGMERADVATPLREAERALVTAERRLLAAAKAIGSR